LPSQYAKDVVQPLQKKGVEMVASVHVECMPDDGVQEAVWVDSLASSAKENFTVQAIVGSCDLASPSVNEELIELVSSTPRLRGVRWIVDCVGHFETNTATHVATTRHDGIDYLRGSHGPNTFDGQVLPAFEHGFSLLAQHNLSFDLQCAPVQLLEAAKLCARHPKVSVCIDHLGKPRTILGLDTPGNNSIDTVVAPDEAELQVWRTGMKAMAAIPNVCVKLSMLGYAIPGWIKTLQRRKVLKSLVRETLEMFGPQRCMIAWNYWKNDAVSDSDFLSEVGPSPVEYLEFICECLEGYSEEDRDAVFYGTAKRFYRITI